MKIGRKSLIALMLSAFPFIGQGQSLRPAASPSPVLIELFTSQGCSSCPPAEDLLNTWGMRLFEQGKALPLAFHVDYWDYQGWKDAFSSHLFTARQRQYAGSFRDRSVYTPEMVVSGHYGFNGSDSRRADSEVASAAKRQKIVPFDIAAKLSGQILTLSVRFDPPKSQADLKNSKIWVVLFENGLETSVAKGENEGKKLKANFVVRSLSEVEFSPKRNAVQTVIQWDKQWESSKTGAAVFSQDPRTMEINGVKWIYPIEKN